MSLDEFTRIPNWVDPQRKLSLEAQAWLESLTAEVASNRATLEWMYNLFLDVFVIAVKGSARMISPTGFPNIGLAYQPITLFDEEGLTAQGVSFDLPNNTFSVLEESEVLLQLNGTFSHNEAQGGRQTFVRLWNVTKGTSGGTVPIGTGRNVGVSSFSTSMAVLVEPAILGDVLRIEIGGLDDYSAVTFDSFSLSITSVGPWLGDRPEIPAL